MSYQPILESFMSSWTSKHFKNIKTFNVTKEKSEAQPHLLSVSKLFSILILFPACTLVPFFIYP